MQSKTEQRKIIQKHASHLDRFCWFVAIYKAGKESSSIQLPNGAIPIVPVVLWPHLGQYTEQAELSRLLTEMMAKSMRRVNPDETRALQLVPSLIAYDDLQQQGFGWEEWQIEVYFLDTVCPHCGAVNEPRCCADWKPKPKPKRKRRTLL